MENREIKFRAWDKERKKFYYPKLWDSSMPSNWESWYDLQQYTGFRDKNGSDIYEGDIIKYTYWHYRKPQSVITDVYWNYHGFYLRNNQTRLVDSRALMAVNKDGEVIGNVFQNPELLNLQA